MDSFLQEIVVSSTILVFLVVDDIVLNGRLGRKRKCRLWRERHPVVCLRLAGDRVLRFRNGLVVDLLEASVACWGFERQFVGGISGELMRRNMQLVSSKARVIV